MSFGFVVEKNSDLPKMDKRRKFTGPDPIRPHIRASPAPRVQQVNALQAPAQPTGFTGSPAPGAAR